MSVRHEPLIVSVVEDSTVAEGDRGGFRHVPTSYMSFKLKAASFLGVVMPFASSLGMMPSRPRPLSQDSMYFMDKIQVKVEVDRSTTENFGAY